MNTKLTLSLDAEVIEKAKTYAKSQKQSLSQLIENYLKRLTLEYPEIDTPVSIVQEMSGIINLDEDLDCALSAQAVTGRLELVHFFHGLVERGLKVVDPLGVAVPVDGDEQVLLEIFDLVSEPLDFEFLEVGYFPDFFSVHYD